jgi:hypothetical protein
MAAVQRFPATLHQGEINHQIEVFAEAKMLTLHIAGKKHHWHFAETRYRSGGVPRFEHGQDLLMVPDHDILKAIEKLNPQALSQMENQAGGFLTASDFLSGLAAVGIVVAGALVLAAIVWFLHK